MSLDRHGLRIRSMRPSVHEPYESWASFIAFVRQLLLAPLLLIVISAGYLGATIFFYDTRNLFVLTLPVLSAFNLSGLFAFAYDFTLERLEKRRTRRTLERYVSRNLVKE